MGMSRQLQKGRQDMMGWMVENKSGLVAGTFATTERAAKVHYMIRAGIPVQAHHNDCQLNGIWDTLLAQNKDEQLSVVQVNIEKVLGTA